MACIVALAVFLCFMLLFMLISRAFGPSTSPALPTQPALPTTRKPSTPAPKREDRNQYAVDADMGPDYYTEELEDGTRVKHYRGSKEYFYLWSAIN
jgi:hypothetical protein